jgi:iron complex outermembrane receptor protein
VAKPTDNLKITIAGDYYHTDDTTATLVFPITVAAPSGIATGPLSSQDSPAGYPSGTHIKSYGGSGKAELDLGGVMLTSITAFHKIKNKSAFDVDGKAADLFHLFYDTSTSSIQQELRLASNGSSKLTWQVGGFYLHAITHVDQTQGGIVFGSLTNHIVARGITDSLSAFGEATYAITPTTHLTGGVRFTSDHRQIPFAGNFTVFVLPSGSPVPGTEKQNTIDTKTYNQVTFRAALRQDLTDKINFYATVNRGFKSGEFNLQSPADPPVKPETIMAYEGGFKGELFDRRLRVEIAGFHYDISDYQVRASPGTVSILLNAAKVKVNGADINTEAALTDRFHATLGMSWLNSYFSRFGGPGTGIIAPGTYPAGRAGNATGNQTALAPHFTINAGGNYTIPINDHGSELRLTAMVTHKSSYVFEADNVLRQPAYNVVSGSIEYRLSGHYGIELYARNIGNEHYNVQEATAVGQYALAGTPKQYGINFKVDY